ncbi:MAG: hypothetical protein ACRED1_08735 [Limisphaerales bacterium]
MLKSIVCTYPDFRMLPKGLKQMLVASEDLFFDEAGGGAARPASDETGQGRHRYWRPPTPRFQMP